MPYRVDARLSGRHPFQDYLVGFMIVVGCLLALDISGSAPSLMKFIPGWAVTVWEWLLFLSALTTMIGTRWRDRAHGLILEQLGLATLGLVILFFTVGLFVANGWDALLAGGLVAGFGLSCLRRWHDIQQVLDQVHAEEQKRKRGKG
jgi:hypothetical protein